MEKAIKKQLAIIEKDKKVDILYAAESGSRAWGFASPDSDYDVRFIYVHDKEHYLRLDSTRDVIEWHLDKELDIVGWDLQKTLRLLYNSNPTVFEWIHSPIVYKSTLKFAGFRQLAYRCFSIKTGIHHYLNMAKKYLESSLESEKVQFKKYFYALRPVLVCKWIIANQTPPPMVFIDLVESQMDNNLKPIIYELIERKIKTPEITEIPRIDNLNEYLRHCIEVIRRFARTLPEDKIKSWNGLNDFFFDILEGTPESLI